MFSSTFELANPDFKKTVYFCSRFLLGVIMVVLWGTTSMLTTFLVLSIDDGTDADAFK